MCKTPSLKETTRKHVKISTCINSEMYEHCTVHGNENLKIKLNNGELGISSLPHVSGCYILVAK